MSDFDQLKHLKIKYILSDFARANVDAHLKNPRLKALFDSGMLDISVFRPDTADEISLELSGCVLKKGDFKNPLIVLANYFFDTIKHDAFRVVNGNLQEAKYFLYCEEPTADSGELPTFDELRMSERCYACNLPYYNKPAIDSILDYYRKNLRDSSVIFPIGAMNTVEKLAEIADGKLAVFASDKGFASLQSKQVLGLREQEFARHGAISFDVNFDALQRFFQNVGGHALIDSGDHSSLGFLVGSTWKSNSQLMHHFFRQYIQTRDVCNSSYNLEEFTFAGCEKGEHFVRPYLTNFIAIVQSSNFDPFIFDGAFARLFERLVPELAEMDTEQELEVMELVERTFNNVFNVGNEYFDLAAILEFCMCWQQYQVCLKLALQAHDSLGPSRKFFDYAALACEHLGRKREAHEYFRQSLLLEPNHDWAREGMERNS